jgi:hypothetical protein
MKLQFHELETILELLENVPKEEYNNGMIKELCAHPGYSYHGPCGKKDNKIGVGLYLTPSVEIRDQDFLNGNNWFYYPNAPMYHINSFISSNEKHLLELCSQYSTSVSFNFDDDNHCWIKAITPDESEFEFKNENKIILLYRLYSALINNSMILSSPSLSDLEDVVDVNSSYNEEPTIVFKDFPFYLKDEPFKRHFDYDCAKQLRNEVILIRNPGLENNKSLYCLGQLKLIEGNFWILAHERDLSGSYAIGTSHRKITSLGGLIKRVI